MSTRTIQNVTTTKGRKLSGRSRAKTKHYFEAADTYIFLVWHATVAFTEPQVYLLLRVLTDEAINITCFAVEEVAIGAIEKSPATASSRTRQFRTRTRAQTPRHRQGSASSSGGFATDPELGSETVRDIDLEQEIEDNSLFNDSDSSGEMALIAETFKRSESGYIAPTERENLQQESP